MENRRTELEYETERLGKTIDLAGKQLEQARLANERTQEEIIEAKRICGKTPLTPSQTSGRPRILRHLPS